MPQNDTILFLGPPDSPLLAWIKENEVEVVSTADCLTAGFIAAHSVSFVVSYGYRHIIKKEVLDLLPGRFVNLHISLLPWNRGADPNLWSFVDDTPKGVSVHYIDEGVDTGDIIVQQEVFFSNDETLASSYAQLQFEIQELFKKNWYSIKSGKCPRIKQQGEGSVHRARDREQVESLLVEGWETRVMDLKKSKSL